MSDIAQHAGLSQLQTCDGLRADWQAGEHLMLAACTDPDKHAFAAILQLNACSCRRVTACVRIGKQAST